MVVERGVEKEKEVEVEYTRLRIPFGPVHPALKEPVSLRVFVKGEEVVDVDMVFGACPQGHRVPGRRARSGSDALPH